MLIVSQDKEKVLWFGRAFNALEYTEQIDKKGKQAKIRHTICISDGCLVEIAEYETKERCLEVLRDFCSRYTEEYYIVEYFNMAAQANIPVSCRKSIVYEFPAE